MDKLDLNCEQCDAHLVYEPGDKHLTCPYCQHEHLIEENNEPTIIEENDLQEYLANIESSVVQEEVKTVQCKSCGAETTFDEQLSSSFCPFCATPLILENSRECQRIQPHYIVPFDLDKKQAESAYKKWLKSLWFAPNALKKLTDNRLEIKGMYLPFWTYDSQTSTQYNGMKGVHYYVTQSYTNSKGQRRTRRVQKTRWYPVTGNIGHFFDDILIAATNSLPTDKLEALEPWNLKNMREYDPRYLVGFLTEQHSVSIEEGLVRGKAKMGEQIERLIRRDIGGDIQRVLSRNSQYSDLKFKHVLLPVWVSSYRYKNKAYQFLVNARTGEVQGQRPWSWIKIGLVVTALTTTIGILIWYVNKV